MGKSSNSRSRSASPKRPQEQLYARVGQHDHREYGWIVNAELWNKKERDESSSDSDASSSEEQRPWEFSVVEPSTRGLYKVGVFGWKDEDECYFDGPDYDIALFDDIASRAEANVLAREICAWINDRDEYRVETSEDFDPENEESDQCSSCEEADQSSPSEEDALRSVKKYETVISDAHARLYQIKIPDGVVIDSTLVVVYFVKISKSNPRRVDDKTFGRIYYSAFRDCDDDEEIKL